MFDIVRIDVLIQRLNQMRELSIKMHPLTFAIALAFHELRTF